jgi:hypothetical protein
MTTGQGDFVSVQQMSHTRIVNDVVAEVDRIRRRLPPEPLSAPAARARLVKALCNSRVLRKEPIVEALIADLRGFGHQPSMSRTKRHINEQRDHHIIAAFDVPYFRSLSFDGLTYRDVAINDHLASRYPSPATPVAIESMSEGFKPRPVVALFPENHIDGSQLPEDRIFYFVDKFVERHMQLTPRLIDAAMSQDSFPRVRAASWEQAERAVAWWMHLHEYHHRVGDMPLPKYLKLKSLKPLAGLEETRVDIYGMLACLDDSGLPREEALFVYEFILAERLLRYAVEGYPRPNYDGVASQLLFNYLREAGGIRVRGDVIHLDRSLPDALASFLEDIARIEARIDVASPEVVQRELVEFTNRYTVFDETIDDYRHLPYFAQLKERVDFS